MKHYIFSTQLQLSNGEQRDCRSRKKQGHMPVAFHYRAVITTAADCV